MRYCSCEHLLTDHTESYIDLRIFCMKVGCKCRVNRPYIWYLIKKLEMIEMRFLLFNYGEMSR